MRPVSFIESQAISIAQCTSPNAEPHVNQFRSEDQPECWQPWRRRIRTAILGLSLCLTTSCARCGVLVYDISPDSQNGVPATGGDSTAGLTVSVAGNKTWLYAVTLNAGVWRSLSDWPKTGPWIQIPKSPELAYCIAIDPNDDQHIAVGERDGDATDPMQNHSGVWESFDGGNTWPDYFDPRAANPACRSQAIRSITITSQSAVVAATPCGVAVRPKGQPFGFPATPLGNRAVTGVASSETKVWARDGNYNLIVSPANGNTWNSATNKPVPAGMVAASPGDASSLAAFDTAAYMSTLGDNNGAGNNFNQLLIWDASLDTWVIQKRIADSLNGTGVGGRRFLKAYVTGPNGQIGTDLQLFFCSAQEIFKATSRSGNGIFQWTRIAATPVANVQSTDPNFMNLVHSEMYDFHLARDATAAWVTTDGGVFETKMDGKGWLTRSSGLHTQHIHTLYTPHNGLHLAYSTQDNNGWFRFNPPSGLPVWNSAGGGDVNWTAGDAGKTVMVVLARQSGPGGAVLSGFGNSVGSPGQTQKAVTLNNDQTFGGPAQNGPLFFRFIQTKKNEEWLTMDAVMLSKMPFQYVDSAGTKVTVLSSGQPIALLRNQSWATFPDVNTGKGMGWEIVADDLPAGTIGFWVSGGHVKPVFYVLAIQSGVANLFVTGLDRGCGTFPPTTWRQISVNGSGQPNNLLVGGRNGPVFVNPYDPNQLYVLTRDKIRVSNDAGCSFVDDDALTSLVTGSGRFQLVGQFPGGNPQNVDKAFQSGGTTMASLEDMAFDHDQPSRRAAVSPFTGVFVDRGDGQWRNLTPYLPILHTPISGVGIWGSTVFIVMEGRGILQINNVDEAD
jgi:hypothetical protein